MKFIIALAWKSLLHRRYSVLLTVVALASTVFLLLSVERVREQSRSSFMSTISGTDLIVAARTSPTQALLFSVFNLGYPTTSMDVESCNMIADLPAVKWMIPLSMGDMHRGFRVVGTTNAYQQHYRYAGNQSIDLAQGHWFDADNEVVIGAEVARSLAYEVADKVVVSHGAGDVSFVHHDDHPYTVSGVLRRTGTPLDRVLLVSLAGLDLMHADFNGSPGSGHGHAGHNHSHDPLMGALEPRAVKKPQHNHEHHGHVHAETESAEHIHAASGMSAVLVGLRDRSSALSVQRYVNTYKKEALTAVLPGVALQDLWSVMAVVEDVLFVIATLVVVLGLMGMLSTLLGSLNERRREMAILRSVGARPYQIITLLLGEALLISFFAILLGLSMLYVLLALCGPYVQQHYGLYLTLSPPSTWECSLMLMVLVAGCLVGLIPGLRIYRLSLSDGLSPK